jgi:hypothetical protein
MTQTPEATPAPLPKVDISDQAPLHTADLRENPIFMTADPEGKVPDVTLAGAPLNPRDRPRASALRVGIYNDGERVGAFNLVQTATTNRIHDVAIERRQGKRLAVAAYLGVIVASHEMGRPVISDLGGLSPAWSAGPARSPTIYCRSSDSRSLGLIVK